MGLALFLVVLLSMVISAGVGAFTYGILRLSGAPFLLASRIAWGLFLLFACMTMYEFATRWYPIYRGSL